MTAGPCSPGDGRRQGGEGVVHSIAASGFLPYRETAMSLDDWFAKLEKDRQARTRRERHGRRELTLLDGMPISAAGCILPDGSPTDPGLTPYTAISNDAQRVWTRPLPGTPLRRRGAPPWIAARRFSSPTSRQPICPSPQLKAKRSAGPGARSRTFATHLWPCPRRPVRDAALYGALCNTTWQHKAMGTQWYCSWRRGGGAALRGKFGG